MKSIAAEYRPPRPRSLNLRDAAIRYALYWLALVVAGLTADAATFQVGVFDHFFEPLQLDIRTGDTVEWTAYGFGHIVISDTGVFDSSTFWGSSIPALRSFKFTFHEAGNYPYYSQDYGGPEGVGMSANITVTGAPTNQTPVMPANLFPAANSTNQSIRLELRADVFADFDGGDVHRASQWLVRRAPDDQLVYDSGEVIDNGGTSNSKTNRFLPDGLLNYGTAYRWQVRFKDSYGAWSPYSATTTFSTLPPTLAAIRQDRLIVFSWPTNTAGFNLEYSTNVAPSTWTSATPASQIVSGQNVLTNNADGVSRVYRLRKNQ